MVIKKAKNNSKFFFRIIRVIQKYWAGIALSITSGTAAGRPDRFLHSLIRNIFLPDNSYEFVESEAFKLENHEYVRISKNKYHIWVVPGH